MLKYTQVARARVQKLVQMAMADGQIDLVEEDLILFAAHHFAIGLQELERLAAALPKEVAIPPASSADLADLAECMLADGSLASGELELFYSVCREARGCSGAKDLAEDALRRAAGRLEGTIEPQVLQRLLEQSRRFILLKESNTPRER